ncbi:tRNA threonylcarbamoyl adenosine modification protein YeaZ [Albidovulum inexpectatum]|uniref:tRNA threonylcarbamoyl adenosine modification protein YeaZ n=1 Tax=Albidovulum inexpectatum TaxID=196587 RepID=A0A2S5JGN9_9RHOB|nr:tRNA (adenosine(37)-N6)-threonylcarbamoyltransferase complex dimerization subunit type 1 TsaB [Albidovulum inexpectatum]PPB80589.1 tRNA threonylcarbamoyl adenosine modification protein YeaZ [Albidovulum inexpectatum]
MPPEATILAFDTSAAHCAAALLVRGQIVDARVETMARGQAERLMPLLSALLDRQGLDWSALDAIGVGIGPGNFTGIRIAVAAARGLALARGIPAIGVSAFESIRPPAMACLAVVPAPRGMICVQEFTAQSALPPVVMPESELDRTDLPILRHDRVSPQEIAAQIARLAAERAHETAPRPAPLYLRPADAAPARDVAPPLLP